MLTVKRRINDRLLRLSEDYTSAYWHYYSLNNQGCYLASAFSEPLRVKVHANDFSGTLTADAAGITATLFALSDRAFEFPRVEILSVRYHQLRDFAAEHAGHQLIFQAID